MSIMSKKKKKYIIIKKRERGKIYIYSIGKMSTYSSRVNFLVCCFGFLYLCFQIKSNAKYTTELFTEGSIL